MLQEIETADPIDYAGLPFSEKELRRLVVGSLVERHQFVRKDLNVDDVRTMYLLSTAKLLLKSTVLHACLLLLQDQSVDVQALLAPTRLKTRPDSE